MKLPWIYASANGQAKTQPPDQTQKEVLHIFNSYLK